MLDCLGSRDLLLCMAGTLRIDVEREGAHTSHPASHQSHPMTVAETIADIDDDDNADDDDDDDNGDGGDGGDGGESAVHRRLTNNRRAVDKNITRSSAYSSDSGHAMLEPPNLAQTHIQHSPT